MKDFLLSEIFRLELRWDKVLYTKDGTCELVGAYFTGPVLQVAQRINDEDFMMLDFYSQYIQLVSGVYVAMFSWSGIGYDDSKVFLRNSFIKHKEELNNVPILKNDDYFVIDTSNHVVEKHSRNLVYKTYLINADNTLYRFSK